MTRTIALVGLSWIAADPAGPASDPTLGTAVPYSHASAIDGIPGLRLVAGCDIAESARSSFLDRWGDRWPGFRAYADYREMLETERPELVSVVTPDHLHAAVVVSAVDAGVRGIFCEKPLATTLADADAILRAVSRGGVTMNVNYTRRWMPEFVEARRIVRAGEIGPLSQVVVQMGGPRAMLFRNHTHAIDIVTFLADGEPDWVWAELEAGYESYGTEYAGDGGIDPATEPGANYYIAYRNGVRAYVTGMKDTLASDLVVHLVGPDGRIVIDLEGIRIISVENEDVRRKAGVPRVERVTPRWTVAGMQAGLLDLINALDTGAPTASPPESARHAVAITQAILHSQARGNVTVRLAEFAPRVESQA